MNLMLIYWCIEYCKIFERLLSEADYLSSIGISVTKVMLFSGVLDSSQTSERLLLGEQRILGCLCVKDNYSYKVEKSSLLTSFTLE